MHLEIAVRFRNEHYEEIGAATIELRSTYEDTPFILQQLGKAAESLVSSLIDHAREEAKASLAKKQEKEEKEEKEVKIDEL